MQAVHYLGRLLEAGDLPSVCRRLIVCACEDVGLAYPMIIPIVKAAVDSALQVGLAGGKNSACRRSDFSMLCTEIQFGIYGYKFSSGGYKSRKNRCYSKATTK